MRNPAELNLNKGGRPLDRPPPTTEIVSAFEREFNVSLPPEYLEFLNYSNGGHPELDSLIEPGGTNFSNWAVNRFFYLNEDQVGSESLWATARECQRFLAEKLIPIAMDGLGNFFILDTSSTPAKVLVWDVHEDELIELASSFEDFIDRLRVDPEDV